MKRTVFFLFPTRSWEGRSLKLAMSLPTWGIMLVVEDSNTVSGYAVLAASCCLPWQTPCLLQSHMTKILSCLCKLEMRCWHMQDPDDQQKTGLPNSIKMFWAVPQVLIRRSVKNKSGNFLCLCATCVLMTYSAKSNTTHMVSNTLAFAEWPFLSFERRYPAKLLLF